MLVSVCNTSVQILAVENGTPRILGMVLRAFRWPEPDGWVNNKVLKVRCLARRICEFASQMKSAQSHTCTQNESMLVWLLMRAARRGVVPILQQLLVHFRPLSSVVRACLTVPKVCMRHHPVIAVLACLHVLACSQHRGDGAQTAVSPIADAAHLGNRAVVRYLLAEGADPNQLRTVRLVCACCSSK